MAPDSNREIGAPSGPSWSMIAGILLFGLMLRNSGANCSSCVMLMALISYGRPSSSRAIEILKPFGVPQVYSVIMAVSVRESERVEMVDRDSGHRAGNQRVPTNAGTPSAPWAVAG